MRLENCQDLDRCTPGGDRLGSEVDGRSSDRGYDLPVETSGDRMRESVACRLAADSDKDSDSSMITADLRDRLVAIGQCRHCGILDICARLEL